MNYKSPGNVIVEITTEENNPTIFDRHNWRNSHAVDIRMK
jgi:hypothetical protein